MLTRALRDRFGDRIELIEPAGGFFVWARLTGGVDSARLFEAAQDAGVTYQRGEWFAAGSEPFRGFLRLSYSEPDADALREGVTRLGQAWRAVGGH